LDTFDASFYATTDLMKSPVSFFWNRILLIQLPYVEFSSFCNKDLYVEDPGSSIVISLGTNQFVLLFQSDQSIIELFGCIEASSSSASLILITF